MTQMTPKEIVEKLDKFIIGQDKAKRAVAIALRNRWRRMQLKPTLRQEISPKNILMIGPTGVGKTEIARRMSKLANAPFIKVEATKFTEVGYVGKEVDSIIRELTDIAIKMVKEEELARIRPRAKLIAEERVLDALLPPVSGEITRDWNKFESNELGLEEQSSGLRELFRKKLRDGSLLDREIEISTSASPMGLEIISAPPGTDEISIHLHSLVQNVAGRRNRKRKFTVAEALRFLTEEEASRLLNVEDLKQKAIEMVEQNGVVFIDEIDKVTHSGTRASGVDVSREGVQRDLLPLIEGCSVSTKYGMVRTDHILFVASGAFQVSSPSELIPELQGRLPIRVELKPLTVDDFKRILTEPDASLTKQYQALLKTEGIDVTFSEEGIDRIAQVAWQINDQKENIGARRLYTVLEQLMEEVSYSSKKDLEFSAVLVDQAYVNKHLEDIILKDDFLNSII